MGTKFECDNCKVCFNKKCSLQKHIILCHKDLYSSEDCVIYQDGMKNFLLEENLNRQTKNRKNVINVCEICNISFTRTSNYYRHYKSKHVGEPFRKNSVKVDKTFECPNCKKCFNREDNLKRHIISLHTNLYSSEVYIIYQDGIKHFRLTENLNCQIKNRGNEVKVCKICNKNFTRTYNYHRHYKSKHVGEQLRKNNVKVDKIFECPNCKKCFNREDNLQRHINSLHNSSEDCFTCHYCSKNFRLKRLLERHIENHVKFKVQTKKRKCPLCHECFANEATILNHFEVIHDVRIKKEYLRFNSESEFYDWKKETQISMNCSYISHSHYDQRGTGKQVWKWKCHRNGNFTPVASRKRQPPKKGSKKMNAFCPSMIKLFFKLDNYDNSTYDVEFISTHIGHSTDEKELIHIRFDSSIRDEVAAKLGAKIPVSKILKDIRHTSGCYLSNELCYKEQLITKKDIRNIGHLRNISNITVKNRGRFSSIDAVEDYVYDPENKDSILFFKNHGEHHPVFKDEDFVLIIMKMEQMEKLMKYGSDIVCIDGSHCTNLYDYTLHTLLVADEYEEGYPCCFMISNKNNDTACQYMFAAIKDKIGALEPISFMSDVQETYINAWRRVMGYEPKFVLWCTWHVKNAWKKHYSQIKQAEKREALKTQLNDLLDEPDKTKFHEKLSEFLCTIDQDYKKFMDYFIDEYVSKYQLWANAYRQHADVSINMRIERFRKSLKYKCTKGVKFEQLGNILHSLDDIENKNEDVLIYDITKKLTIKESLLRKAHNEALTYESVENLIFQKGEKEYVVKSLSDDLQEYTIVKMDCNVINCMVRCEECKVCIHQFKCTCPENFVRNIMCKHIHLLCLQQSEELSSQDENVTQKPDIHVENEINTNIQSYLVSSPIPAEVKIDELKEQCRDIVKNVSTENKNNVRLMLNRIDSTRYFY